MNSVRTHTRVRNGRRETVHRHDRSNRGKTWSQMQKRSRRRNRRRSGAAMAWRNTKRAFRYARRNKPATAAFFGTVAGINIASFLAIRGLTGLGAVAAVLTVVPAVLTVRAVRSQRRMNAINRRSAQKMQSSGVGQRTRQAPSSRARPSSKRTTARRSSPSSGGITHAETAESKEWVNANLDDLALRTSERLGLGMKRRHEIPPEKRAAFDKQYKHAVHLWRQGVDKREIFAR